VVEVKAIMMTNSGRMLDKSQKLEVIVDSRSSPCPNRHMMKSGSMRSSRREMISHMWWRNVKLVLIFDLIICLILLAIWLGVCQGFHCVKEEM
jgi:vesicle-associated membrane protein 7